MRRHFHEASIGQHCWGSMQTDATLLRLRFAGHRTIEMLGLVTQQVPTLLGFHANRRNIVALTLHRSQNNRNVKTCYATSANIVVVPCKRTQQITTLLGPTILGVVGQQCWVRLHGLLLNTVRATLKGVLQWPKSLFGN